LAARLAHEERIGASRHLDTADADAALAAQLAREEGIDIEVLRAQERDEAYARKLAREINSDVVAMGEQERERGN
jgi:nucleotide-binding universal stress UspA family protein